MLLFAWEVAYPKASPCDIPLQSSVISEQLAVLHGLWRATSNCPCGVRLFLLFEGGGVLLFLLVEGDEEGMVIVRAATSGSL
jgi:hypothetical protein